MGSFFYFLSKRLSRYHDSGHGSVNIGFAFYCAVPVSCPKSRVWRANLVDSVFLIDFFLISSFNIVFDEKLSFMICFILFFVRLSWSYNSRIMLNELINADLAHFYVIFLIKSFSNFII